MHIHFFIQVINFLKRVSEEGVLLEKYRKLEEILKEISKNPEKDYSEELFFAKEQLKKLLLQNDPADLGYDAYRLFEKIDKHRLLGKPAADYIQELLTSEDKDYQEIHSELSNKTRLLLKQSTAISQFYDIFDEIILSELLNASVSKEIVSGLYLYFEGQVAVRNINDLEKYTRIWNGVLQSFSELTGFDKQSLEFCSLHDGFIVLGVATEGSTLEALMKGTIGILSSYSLIVKIRKAQIELTPLPLYNNYYELLDTEIEGVINQSASAVAEELISKYYQSGTGDTTRVTENLCRALKQILNFIEKGGKLECKPSSDMIGGDELSKKLMRAFINLGYSNDHIPEPTPEIQIVPESNLTHA